MLLRLGGMAIFGNVRYRSLGSLCFLIRHALSSSIIGEASIRSKARKRPGGRSRRSQSGGDIARMPGILLRLLSPDFPALGIFPGDVSCVIHVQEQSFAAVEKSEAEKIVVDKCRQWP